MNKIDVLKILAINFILTFLSAYLAMTLALNVYFPRRPIRFTPTPPRVVKPMATKNVVTTETIKRDGKTVKIYKVAPANKPEAKPAQK